MISSNAFSLSSIGVTSMTVTGTQMLRTVSLSPQPRRAFTSCSRQMRTKPLFLTPSPKHPMLPPSSVHGKSYVSTTN